MLTCDLSFSPSEQDPHLGICATALRSHTMSEIVNQGKLVSDEIIINLLSRRLEEGEEKGELGFILDGFPRTMRQAVS
jgi:adenylate kinase family enzyme